MVQGWLGDGLRVVQGLWLRAYSLKFQGSYDWESQGRGADYGDC